MIMKTILALSLLLVSCSATLQKSAATIPVPQEKTELRLIIPKDTWEPIFFEEINKRAKIAKLRNLRSTILPGDDLEVRVWVGFGLSALEGFIIRRDAGQWSAKHLEGIYPGLPRSEYQKKLQVPKSGWEAFWKRVVDEGLLTLPDSSDLKNGKLIEDGASYVVETNMNRTYRTYQYGNPDWQEWKEAKQIIKISNIIAEEFGQQEFRTKAR